MDQGLADYPQPSPRELEAILRQVLGTHDAAVARICQCIDPLRGARHAERSPGLYAEKHPAIAVRVVD